MLDDDVALDDVPALTSGSLVLGVVLLTVAIVLVSVTRFPGSMWHGGQADEIGTVSGLLAYAGVAYAVRGAQSGPARAALGVGSAVGAVLAVLQITFHLTETHVALGPRAITIIGASNWCVLVLGLGGASFGAYMRVRSTALAMLASLWAALVSTSCLIFVAFSTGLLFMAQAQRQLFAAYEASGMTDPRAFVVHTLLESAASRILLPPALALVLGVAGACSAWLLLRSSSSGSQPAE